MSVTLQTHFRTCNLCEAMCGIAIQHDGTKVHSIRGDKDDPFSNGYICPKAVALQDIYEDPDRLKRPLKKTADGHIEISWEEAFDTIETKIKSIIKEHGPDAFGAYQGNPNVHNHGTMLFGPQFVRLLKTKNRFSATSVDQLPHHFAAQFMFGHMFLLPIPDIDHTDLFIVFGGNPIVSNGSIMTAPGMPHRIKALQKRGGKMIVIDPRRTETAEKADQHIFIKPGTDALLLMSMVQVIITNDLVDLGHLSQFTDRLELLPSLVSNYTPKVVAPIIGIDENTIVKLAYDLAKAKKAVVYGRLGVSVQSYGGLCQWLVNVLNIITGNMDTPGGAMFPLPAIDTLQSAPNGTMNRYNRWQSSVRNLPEFGSELPVAALIEQITTPGKNQIKALFTSAGNPVLSTPNGRELDKALEQVEFIFSVDIYLNETTRHADIILPPTTGLENDHYDLVFHQMAVRNTAKYSSALFAPSSGAKYDWEIFKELIARFLPEGKKAGGPQNPDELLDLGLKYGPYGKSKGMSLDQLKQKPHGIDLGPLQSCLPDRLFTPDKRINVAPEVIISDISRLGLLLKSNQNDDLLLIGRRHLRSNNSWMHNSYRLVKGPKRCTLMMHPEDANGFKLNNSNEVKISSRTGDIVASLEITDEVMPGVVSLPHGWGHHRKGTKWQVAEAHAGVSCNDIMDEQLVDELTGNAVLNGVPVTVTAV